MAFNKIGDSKPITVINKESVNNHCEICNDRKADTVVNGKMVCGVCKVEVLGIK